MFKKTSEFLYVRQRTEEASGTVYPNPESESWL